MERYGGLGLGGFMKAGEILLASGRYEEASMAIRFVKEMGEQFDGRMAARLAGYFQAGIRNWGHTDVLCGEVIAPPLASGRIGLAELADRRVSKAKSDGGRPVAMLGLLREAGDGPAAGVPRPMMMDPERGSIRGSAGFCARRGSGTRSPSRRFSKSGKTGRPGSSSNMRRRR